jgi:poly-gamma-glutamate system protein
MNIFRAKSNIVLSLLSVLALLALITVENGKIDVKQEWYNEKLEAAQLAQVASNCLKNYRLENGIFIDAINDPNQTALIGQEFTLITTDRGYIDAKLSSTNPNFAAIIVQFLKDAGVKEKDHVAIAFTGSFPGLNIAVLAAVETLKLKPVVITSVGSSNYGANDPYFTWLDMENVLLKSNVFHNKSVAASIGGGFDVGRGLSPEGRDLILKAIERNGISLINENNIEKSIARRMEIYEESCKGQPVKAFINVGGGIASLGNTINGKFIPPGLTLDLSMRNFPVRGVIVQMAQNEIPIIHLMNINQLLKKYELPYSPVPLPDPGEGGIFVTEKYNVAITSVATLFLVIVIVLVYMGERKYYRLGTDVVPSVRKQEKDKNDTDSTPEL